MQTEHLRDRGVWTKFPDRWWLPTRSIRTSYAGLINVSFIKKKKKILLKRSFIMYDVYQFYIKMDQFSLEKRFT